MTAADRLTLPAVRPRPPLPVAGRRRRVDPALQVTLVLVSGEVVDLPSRSALAAAMGHVAALLAHR